MGTRSLTIFVERTTEKPKTLKSKPKVTESEIAVMYRQYDGYPSGHGMELAEFLNRGVAVNGIPGGGDDKLYFNGVGCMSAQVVANFKSGPGGIYLYKAGTRNCWEEYTYKVIFNHDKGDMYVTMECKEEGFVGTPKEFIEKFGS